MISFVPRGYPNNRTKKLVGQPPDVPEVKDAPVTAPPAAEPSAESFPDREAKASRFYLSILDNNKIDVESLRASSKERLQVVLQSSLKDDDFRKFIGLTNEQAPPPAQIVSPKLLAGLFDTISNVQAAVYAKQTGMPFAEVQRLVAWTEAEHAFLDTQGAALANKYIPPKWLQYSDVTLFAVLLYTMMKQKAVVVATYQQDRMKRMGVPDKAPPPPVQASEPAQTDTPPSQNGAGSQAPISFSADESSRSLG